MNKPVRATVSFLGSIGTSVKSCVVRFFNANNEEVWSGGFASQSNARKVIHKVLGDDVTRYDDFLESTYVALY